MNRQLQPVSTADCPGTHEPGSLSRSVAAILLLATLSLTVSVQADVRDAEIAGFRFTDISGFTSFRYLLDDRERASLGGTGSFETQNNFEADLFFLTRSYLYHPDFLDMKIGGGPLLVFQDFSATPGTNSNNEALFNFIADLSFLQQKAYPVRTYYKRSHPSVTTSLSGRFLVERNEFGLNAQLRDPISPVQFTLDAFHIDTIGSGFGTTLDENIDEVSLNAFRSYREADRVSLTYRWNQRDSLSGSPGLPLQESVIITRATDVDARNVFGADGQLELVQQFNLADQETALDTLSELQDLRYFGNLNWTHSRDTRSFYQLRRQETRRSGQSDVTRNAVVAGGSHQRGQYLLLSGEATGTEDRDDTFERRIAGVRATVRYNYPTSFGSVNFGAGLGVRRTDQASEDDRTEVFDEPAVMSGTDLIDLGNDFVIAETVIVRNQPKTQEFVEGIDYRLVVVGSSTSMQRLVGGNIADGQTVLVEYSYQTGGTVKFDTLSQNYVVDIKFLNIFSAYARLTDRDHKVVGGTPTIPLNAIQSIQLGGRVDYPFADRWTIGGEYLRTDQNEEIASYVRDSYDAYVEVILPLTSSFRLMLHQETVDNEGSIEDVDLVQYRVNLRSRPFRGIVLSWSSDYLKDDGGSLLRERTSHDLTIQWVYRQMRFLLRGEQFSETLGATVRDNMRVTAQIRRAF